MLVLTRKAQQSFMIGDNIEIKILEFKGKRQVLLGIEAPKDILIKRDNIKSIIKEQENQATDGTSTTEEAAND